MCGLRVRKRALEMWNYIRKRKDEDLKIGRTALFPSRFCVVGPFDAVDGLDWTVWIELINVQKKNKGSLFVFSFFFK